MTTIEIRGLVKRYRSTLAVNGLTFDVRPSCVMSAPVGIQAGSWAERAFIDAARGQG